MIKITKKICNAVGIINEWDYAGGTNGEPFVTYINQVSGRGYQPSRWAVYQDGKNLNDDGFWQNYNKKVFDIFSREDKSKVFEKCVSWFKSKFGIESVVKTPIGNWMDEKFVIERNKEIEIAYKNGISFREK